MSNKLGGVIRGRASSHCSGPVVVQVGHLVGKLLHPVRGDVGRVLDDVVRRRVDSSLVDREGHQEKVVSLRLGLQIEGNENKACVFKIVCH